MRRRVGWWTIGCVLLVTHAGSLANAQADAGTPSAPRTVAGQIHDRGRYPNDLMVEPEPEASDGDGGTGTGASQGHVRRMPIPIYGGRGEGTLAPDPAPESSGWPDWLPDLTLPRWFLWLLGAIGKGALALVILAIVLMIGGIVYLLFRFRKRPPDDEAPKKKRAKGGAEEAGDAVDPLLAMPTLGHEELARQGRYREAVHALLVSALLATGWVPEGRGRGMTAREIASGYQQPSPPREPLLELLAMVERIWFGGREATAETYASALAAFRRFVPEGAQPT